MIASTLVTLALQALLASSDPHQAAPPPAAAVEQADPHAGHAAAPADAHAPSADAHGGGHGEAAGGHGGGHDESLGAVMMHHVADGSVIEYPGYCHGGFAWNCEWNLKETFGDALELDLATMRTRNRTAHYAHHGYTRALYLANGDILLSGPAQYDPKRPGEARKSSSCRNCLRRRTSRSRRTPAISASPVLRKGTRSSIASAVWRASLGSCCL